MDSQARRILLAAILEVQECLQEQHKNGEPELVRELWLLQREKATRLKSGDYYTKPHSSGTTEAN